MDNILDYIKLASQDEIDSGMEWYPTAKRQMMGYAERYGKPIEVVTAACSVLSPGTSWSQNLAHLENCLQGIPSGRYKANVIKAMRIIEHYDLSQLRGDKVTSFCKNILGDTQSVTVDTWAWRVWAGASLTEKVSFPIPRLWDIVDDYREVASRLCLEPRQAQAITWVTIRRIAKEQNPRLVI